MPIYKEKLVHMHVAMCPIAVTPSTSSSLTWGQLALHYLDGAESVVSGNPIRGCIRTLEGQMSAPWERRSVIMSPSLPKG